MIACSVHLASTLLLDNFAMTVPTDPSTAAEMTLPSLVQLIAESLLYRLPEVVKSGDVVSTATETDTGLPSLSLSQCHAGLVYMARPSSSKMPLLFCRKLPHVSGRLKKVSRGRSIAVIVLA